mmetsp:Transcript_83680/g.135718  ORF Transcript_83680/g.135718 Transcript_83680/m.135718 type:complete len:140 (-) Transcript_83680:359-778(-)|eukprot:CAMPEP_0179420148 /NCGR_PEP_ID=MMETSP0799-20121207/9006_1 /TAXON_ID=46947 /ORGANISM="Geminigera cryophila, Strain CCMP2564" /LENGTH=139 /DNA_ID=CAMNT_0021193725 /DNA_START=97 /DNA_END=516 /DNA_ORIENTATION=-
MGNAGSAIECCGPCSIDKNGARGIRDMEDVRAMDPRDGDTRQNDKTRGILPESSSLPSVGDKNFTFRNMTRQDYFCLYDAIHTLVRQDDISKEQENVLYDLIGRQDKGLAAAYQRYKEGGDPVVLLEPLKDRNSKFGKP